MQLKRFQAQLDPADDGRHEQAVVDCRRLHRELLSIERGVVTELRDQGVISDDVLRRCLDMFGCEFVQLYGLTETSSSMTEITATAKALSSLHRLESGP